MNPNLFSELQTCPAILKGSPYITWAKINSWSPCFSNLANIFYFSECHCLPLIFRPQILAPSSTVLPFITNIYFLQETYWLCHLTISQLPFFILTALILVLSTTSFPLENTLFGLSAFTLYPAKCRGKDAQLQCKPTDLLVTDNPEVVFLNL